MRISLPGASFTATMRMVDRIHGHSTNGWASSHPACTASLADLDIFVVDIADLAHSRPTILMDLANFTRRQAHLSVFTLFGNQLARRTAGPDKLPALTQFDFKIMYGGSKRHVSKRQVVSRAYISLFTCHNRVADIQVHRPENISLDAIFVVQQGNMRRTIRIILNSLDEGLDIQFLALEVDFSQVTLMAATSVPD